MMAQSLNIDIRDALSRTTLFWWLGAIFLFCNTVARFGVLFSSKPGIVQIAGILGIGVCTLLLVKPGWAKGILFCFALTLPLYGSKSYSTNSFLFELYATCLASVLWYNTRGRKGTAENTHIICQLLVIYGLLSFLSLLLSPVHNIVWKYMLWHSDSFWNALFTATPESVFYSLAKVNQLFLFSLFAIALARQPKARTLFNGLFVGLLCAAVWASIIGIINHYQIINLTMVRVESYSHVRLQSVFGNPGWFAEFVSISIPFVLLGFVRRDLSKLKKIGLFGVLIVCEIAIILTYSRTGWLIYPFVLVVCWLFFYLATQVPAGRFNWKRIGKILVRTAVSVPLTIAVSYFLIFHLFNIADKPTSSEMMLEQRISALAKPATRLTIWQESVHLVQEKAVFGLGYESFKYHNTLLDKVRTSWDTPHNMYLQMAVSGGVTGLFLWLLLMVAVLILLVSDMVRNKNYANIAVILSVAAFHLYGLAQSMQYIPLIWFLVFLNIGYTMTIDEDLLPGWAKNAGSVSVKSLAAVVVLAAVVYASDFESRTLANENNMEIYALDQKQNNYLGFYPVEQWQQGKYRWTADGAIIRLPKGKIFELTYVCGAPDLEGNPVIVTVFAGHKEIDTVSFYRPESMTRQYYLPLAMQDDLELYFQVSRTWNLRKLGLADDLRNLGVAISEVKVLEAMPDAGVGLYHWETWNGRTLPGEKEEQFDYRWMGATAVVPRQQLQNANVLFVRAGQPGLPKKPLVVKILQQNMIVGSISLHDTDWHRVELTENVRDDGGLLTIKSARTWNAKSLGVGEDSRNLGIAVAGVQKSL